MHIVIAVAVAVAVAVVLTIIGLVFVLPVRLFRLLLAPLNMVLDNVCENVLLLTSSSSSSSSSVE
jgi:hypothetical protein